MNNNHNKTIIVTLLVICAIHTSHALAISPKNHRLLTTAALSAYKTCIRQLQVIDTLSDGFDIIVNSSGLEDESPVITRFFNWHFFDAYKDDKANAMGRHFTGARKSLHHIYNSRADSLLQAIRLKQNNKVYDYTGRLLHYIQDMTVPVHVAPIFHYKFYFIDESDYFDEISEWGNDSFTDISEICHLDKININDLKVQLNDILNNTAYATRSRMTDMIPVTDDHPLSGKTWEEFWIIRDPANDEDYDTISGFSTYGNQGRDGFKKLCNGSSSDRKACLSIFNQSYRSGITSTVKTLLLINSIRLNEK